VAGRVIAVDAADFATANGDSPMFAVSTEATLHEEDTTPLALVTGAQGSGVLATPTQSMFQGGQIALRCLVTYLDGLMGPDPIGAEFAQVAEEIKLGAASLGKSVLAYVNDGSGSPQVQSVTSYDDTGAPMKVDFDYDQYGNVINKRNAWSTRSVAYVRLVPPGAADTVHFRLQVPENAGRRITLRAKVNYRKFSWWNTQWAYAGVRDPAQPKPDVGAAYDDGRWLFTGDTSKVSGAMKSIPDLPITVMAQSEASLSVLPKNAPLPAPDATHPWPAHSTREDRGELPDDRRDFTRGCCVVDTGARGPAA
jgi:hypothetical protein